MTIQVNPRLVMSKVRPKKLPSDMFDQNEGEHEGLKRLDIYYNAWVSLSRWRNECAKWARYANGDQWHERVQDDNGIWISEGEYISRQGKVPLKQNVLKPVMNSIVGQFRSDRGKTVITSRTKDKGKETEMLTNALQSALDYNDVKELDSQALVQKMVTGLPLQRVSFQYFPTDRRHDVFVENVNVHNIFFNSDVDDVNGRDIRLIGRIIDTTYGQLLVNFGKTPKKANRIKEIYGNADKYRYVSNFRGLDPDRKYSMDFYIPDDESKCRVIEAWELKTIKAIFVHDWMDGSEKEFDGTLADVEKINMMRTQKYAMAGLPADEVPILEPREEYVHRWFYGYYSPFGDILEEGETPYWHGSHPYITGPLTMIDNRLTGLIHDLYDQQRQINRLITLQDFILGTSAKNTLVVDEASLNGMRPEDVAEEYTRVGGVLVLKLKNGEKPPFELGKNAVNLGIHDMLQLQLKMIQDISGVHPSLQGQQAQSGTPASRVITEAQNSSLNLKVILEPFNTFRKDRNEKVLKTIQQFYKEPRWLSIAGTGYSDTARLYDPEEVRDVEFDMVLAQSSDSPVYRNVIDEALKEFLMAGMINFETYLQNTSLPYADTLLESVRQAKGQAQTDPQGAIQALQSNPNLQGNPQAQQMIMQGLRQ